MSNCLCINPNCPKPQRASDEQPCQACASPLLLNGRYRATHLLHQRNIVSAVFEAIDVADGNKSKVLKVIYTDNEEAISRFNREADVLMNHWFKGIPRGYPEGYFHVEFPNNPKPAYCLVMEKIEGMNLQEWMDSRENQPISEREAIDWLRGLVIILGRLHEQNEQKFYHRDIKPSNIMRRENGQLILIDLGAARAVTQAVLNGADVTRIGTDGYGAPEQLRRGQVTAQSDFYALGRTFVHLLTGKYPNSLPEDSPEKLRWLPSAPQVSKQFADLIDSLMDPFYQNRPLDARKILHRIEQIEHPLRGRLLKGGVGLGLILFCIAVFVQFIPKTCPVKIGDNLSCGEENLFPTQAPPEKAKAAQEITKNNYKNAILLLEKARKIKPTDPETLIYLNNARLGNQSVYTIAVAVPIDKNPFTAKEILWGVAIAQDEINRDRKIKGKGIRVEIANDANQVAQAKTIAGKLNKQVDLFAVIGHYASEVTLSTLNVYQQSNLVLISPTSTSETLGNHLYPYFFRTITSDSIHAKNLANYLIKQFKKKQVAVFYNPQSNYSKSLHGRFLSSYKTQGGEIVTEFDLSDPEFDEINAINQAGKQGATAFVLFPDARTSEFVFNNTLKVISANQCRYPMVGGDTVYNSDFLKPAVANCLVLAIPWHELNNTNSKFIQLARNLGAQEVTYRTALTYDAMSVLIAALAKNPKSNRYLLQKTLKDPKFEVTGATGKITFTPNGDRKEAISQLVTVIKNNCQPSSYLFVPLNSPTVKSGSGNCHTQTTK